MTLLLLFHGGAAAVIPPAEPIGLPYLGIEERHRAALRIDERNMARLTITRRED